jgi:CheY-like chemotaxis protein
MASPDAARPAVLVVDDEEDIRMVVQMALEDAGFHVATARDGAEALTRIAEDRPTVILLDLNMPVMNGWQVLQELAAAGYAVSVVIMTAGQRACEEAEKHHAAGCLPKPFDLRQLVEVVARFTRPAA